MLLLLLWKQEWWKLCWWPGPMHTLNSLLWAEASRNCSCSSSSCCCHHHHCRRMIWYWMNSSWLHLSLQSTVARPACRIVAIPIAYTFMHLLPT